MRVEKPTALVLASTYPRWMGDHEPGFVHELARRLTGRLRVLALSPHAPGARSWELMHGVEVTRYRYAPEVWETLVSGGGIIANLRLARWKLLLVPTFVLAQAWTAWRLIRRERIDVIHAHWLIPQGLIAALLQSLPGRKVPFVVTSHGADLYALRGGLLAAVKRFVVRRAAKATVVSSAMREHLRVMGVDVAKVSVLSMGVDLGERFSPDASVPRSEREILFVGRLVEKKGLRYLLDAMALVQQRVPGAILTIAGFGPEEAVLKAQACMLGLASTVRFLGPVAQEELPSLYRRAAVFVAPFVRAESGDEEGLGLVVAEAVGCGCPVIVGDVPAVHELLGAWPQCLVDPRDSIALAAKIANALESVREVQQVAVELRQTILTRFDWQHVATAYAEHLAAAQAQQQ